MIDGTVMEEFLQALLKDGQLYLPLGEFSSLLNFPIEVNADQKSAEGWYIRDKYKISLSQNSATVKGEKTLIKPQNMIVKDQDLFIDSNLMQTWFPMDFALDLQNMSLSITTRETLPYVEALIRKKLYASLDARRKPSKDIEYKNIYQPYAAVQWPSVDLTLSTGYQSEGKTLQTDYSTVAAGDLGYLTARFYAAGNYEQKYVARNSDKDLATGVSSEDDRVSDNSGQKLISDIRLSFGRSDYEANLLGPLKASSYLFGDINSISLSQVTSAGQGRGFKLTNRALDRPDNFDITNFIGDSRPGWDVELYRNEALIAFQTVGSNGRYEFRDIPVLFGSNVFRLAFFGPQGQRDEIVKTVNGESSILGKGEFTYNVSADQKSKSLFGVAELGSLFLDESKVDELGSSAMLGSAGAVIPNSVDGQIDAGNPLLKSSDGIRVVNELEYGISRNLTVALGSATTTIDNQARTYITTGTRSSFLGMLVALDGVHDTTNNGYSTRLSISSNIFDTNIQIQQKIADEFISETNNNLVVSETGVNLNRGIDLPLLGLFDNGLILARRENASGFQEDIVNYTVSKSLLGFNFNNSLRYTDTNVGASLVDGTVTLRKSFMGLTLFAQADLEAKPQKQVTRNRFISLFPITDRVANYTAFINDFSKDGVMQVENAVTFDMNHYNFSLAARADEKKKYFLGFSINKSFGKIPGADAWVSTGDSLADSGTVGVRPFLDRNYNQVFDEGDEFLTDIGIKFGQKVAKTNKKYYAIASQLPTSLPIDITLNQEVRDDLYGQNRQLDPGMIAPAYRVVPRPGRVSAIDFPVFETGQLDGVVHVPEGIDPAELQVDLINTEGQVIRSARTAFDGYYLLEGILPGTYMLRVAQDSLESRQLKQPVEPQRVIAISDIYEQDIKLELE